MKVIWIGQAGLMLEINNKIILIDPYLSDSIAKTDAAKKRRIPIDSSFLNVKPDVVILTHNHLDHTDPETLKYYLKEDTNILVLASKNAWNTVRKFGGNNNYIMFNKNTEWSAGDILFRAVNAEHSDEFAIGVIIEAENKRIYITGDTLYNADIFKDIPDNVDVVFLPVNGVGNNMNMQDAKRFCERINPQIAVPVHCGMFDDIDMNEFDYKNKIVPQIYKEIEL